MTEERMICEQHSFKKTHYAPEVTTTNTHEEIYIEVKTTWIPVEPAPPKDWRPACWTGELEYDANNCIDPWIDDDEVTEPCLSCPYHKLE